MKQITQARKGPSSTTKMGTTYDPWATQKAARKQREQARQSNEPIWLDDDKNLFPVEPPILLKHNIWEELRREEQWGKLTDNEKQTAHRSAVEETWDAITQARSTSGVKQRKGVKVRMDWTVGTDPTHILAR